MVVVAQCFVVVDVQKDKNCLNFFCKGGVSKVPESFRTLYCISGRICLLMIEAVWFG